MTHHILEDLPKRDFPAGAAPSAGKFPGRESGEKKSPEKRIRQAVYDIRYRARREDLPLQSAFSQYMQNSSLSSQERISVKQKLFGKGPVQSEDFKLDLKNSASSSVANALFKVFVEGYAYQQEEIHLDYLEELKGITDRKYKVRVTDKNGKSYVRYATREKINSLRANPNIESVEMTEYGEPYEGERSRGIRTAAAKAGKDYDGDGKVESGAKEHAGVVHNAIQRKKGGNPNGQDTSSVKEEFLSEKEKSKKNKKIDIMRGKNKIVVNPSDGGPKGYNESFLSAQDKFFNMIQEKAESEQQQKLFGLALSVKRGETPRSEATSEVLKIVDTMSEKKIRDFAKTKHEGIPNRVQKEENECSAQPKSKMEIDPRSLDAKRNVLKNKIRSATGMKNPIIMTT